MAQSNNESNVRGIPPFWQNHTVGPAIPWEDWSDLFHLAVIAKENIDIENLINPSERHHPQPQVLEIRWTANWITKENKESTGIYKNKNVTKRRKRHP